MLLAAAACQPLLSAELLIRLFSSARTRSLTLLRVAASSAATGSVVVRTGAGRGRQPDELRVQRVRVQVGRPHLTGAAALERDPFGDVASSPPAYSDDRIGGARVHRLGDHHVRRRPARVGAVCPSRPGRSRSATGRALRVPAGLRPPFCGKLMFLMNSQVRARAPTSTLTALSVMPGEPRRRQRAGRVGKNLLPTTPQEPTMNKREHRRRARPPTPIAPAAPRGTAGRWRRVPAPRRNARRLMAFLRAPLRGRPEAFQLPRLVVDDGPSDVFGVRFTGCLTWVRNALLLTSSMISCLTEPVRTPCWPTSARSAAACRSRRRRAAARKLASFFA